MRVHIAVSLCALVWVGACGSAQSADGVLTFPQKRGATYDEIVKYQALGRFVLAEDGSFFVYEWSRPYEWAPDQSWVPRVVAQRQQTFLYRVMTPEEWFVVAPTSDELFPPAPGATYYLGSLSPDGKRVTFYELDWDDRQLRAGAVQIKDSVVTREEDAGPPKLTWFELTPDMLRLDEGPVWVTDNEVVYPAKGKQATLAKADAETGSARMCGDCPNGLMEKSASVAASGASGARDAEGLKTVPPLPREAVPVAQSREGGLSVFAVDMADELKLLMTRSGKSVTLFENSRKPKSFTSVAAAKE